MDFTVIDEEELKPKLLSEGEARFLVKEASEGFSKSGNAQMVLKLDVQDRHGVSNEIIDYLPATNKMIWKINHFLKAAGKKELYQRGQIKPQDCEKCTGWLTLKEEEYQGKKYMRVKDYLQKDNSHPPSSVICNPAVIGAEDELKNDLPF